MGIKIDSEFREPTLAERSMLRRLLEPEFPGKNDLAPLLADVLVKTIDQDGSLALQSRVEGTAATQKRVPVEAEAKDEDGAAMHILLHVSAGRPVELEFFREDTATVKRIPTAAELDVIVLPPPPSEGWASS